MALYYFILLCCFVTINGEENKICDVIDVRGNMHQKEYLEKGLNRPYQLSYFKHKHQIYYSVNAGNETKDEFEIRVLEKNSGLSEPIKNVPNGFATAIDENKGFIYFGGSDGIYKRHCNETKLDKIVSGHNIWDMFFKNHLYFISYPSQHLYKFSMPKHIEDSKNKHHKWIHTKLNKDEILKQDDKIHEQIYQFAIDDDDDIFIANKTGLFMIKNNTKHRIQLHGEKMFRAIAITNKGEARFAGQNAIYAVNKSNHTLHKIADIKNIFGLTFDHEDNIIYSNPHQIVKLVPSTDPSCKIFVETIN